MSLAFQSNNSSWSIWMIAALFSLGLHIGLPLVVMQDERRILPEPEDKSGVTGVIMFNLSDIVQAADLDTEDNSAAVDSQAAPTILESPEAVDPAKVADEPILAQIPYKVEDDSLKFAIASQEPEQETEKLAEEIAQEFDEEMVDKASASGADESQAADEMIAGFESENAAESATAKSEGLTEEEKEELAEWQKNIVLLLSRARHYPKQARRNRVEGQVLLRFTVDEYGNIIGRYVETSSGSQVLDKAAMDVLTKIGKIPTPPSHLKGKLYSILAPIRYSFR